ncbi:MAG: hypothetical protein M3378_05190 [Actinomycetota bacterium]|nr:hypothetical protein [Actinomycetota bacterium]MDQ3679932.1 hypothetical protein [Actinomycetota bacterium]
MTMVAVIGVISMINHFSGHDWGDDFALYMRQAKALTTGNIGEVISDNRFSVDNSGWHTFSPYSYPWGWPLVIAPFYAVFGLNYELFKFLEVIAFCVFLLAFFAIVRRRAGTRPATILTLLIGLSPSYVGATDTVLSDIPFLCSVGLSLWWMDRCRLGGILGGGRHRLVILGLLLAYTYNVRREGIVLLFSLVALHLAVLAGTAVRAGSVQALRDLKWREVRLPYMTFLAAIVTFHLLLPTVLLPRASGAGVQNISSRLTYYQDILAQQVGLQDPGQPMQLLGSEAAARFALALLVMLAVIGVIGRLLYRLEEDSMLAAYLCGSSFLMLVSPYQEGRYLLTVTPLLGYFAYQALPSIAQLVTSGNQALVRLTSVVPALAVAGLVTLNAQALAHSTNYHLDYHYIAHGPESPDAQQMFTAVRDLTREDDVILFFRARAMTLYSDRPAIMGTNLDQLLKRADWYVMAKDSTYSQTLLTDEQAAAHGLAKKWENTGWVIWRVPPRDA